MSTKSTIFLTDDNIHWYEDCSEPNFDANDKFIGDSIILEFDTSFAKINQYGSEIFIVEFSQQVIQDLSGERY